MMTVFLNQLHMISLMTDYARWNRMGLYRGWPLQIGLKYFLQSFDFMAILRIGTWNDFTQCLILLRIPEPWLLYQCTFLVDYRLSEEPTKNFDQKLNRNQLIDCSLLFITNYESNACKKYAEDYAEAEAVYLIVNMDTETINRAVLLNLPWVYQKWLDFWDPLSSFY